jgi:hypothetical protein
MGGNHDVLSWEDIQNSSGDDDERCCCHSLCRKNQKKKLRYFHNTFSDYGSIYLVDMVLISTYNILISFRSGL